MYAVQFLKERGYVALQPPYFMNKDVMGGVAQLEEYDEALYKVEGEKGDEKYLIATSEQALCSFVLCFEFVSLWSAANMRVPQG